MYLLYWFWGSLWVYRFEICEILIEILVVMFLLNLVEGSWYILWLKMLICGINIIVDRFIEVFKFKCLWLNRREVKFMRFCLEKWLFIIDMIEFC